VQTLGLPLLKTKEFSIAFGPKCEGWANPPQG
jgi:hypothetical protein